MSDSIRTLKSRLEQWGVKKNLGKADMEILIMKEDYRKSRGKTTTFMLGGRKMKPARFATFRKRHAKSRGPVPPPDARKFAK